VGPTVIFAVAGLRPRFTATIPWLQPHFRLFGIDSVMTDPEPRPEFPSSPTAHADEDAAERRARFFRILILWIGLALLFAIVWTFLGPVRR